MAYTDSSQVSNFLQRALTAYETSELTNIIAAIQIWLDKRLNSTFGLVTETTRYYDGGRMNLDIDPCTTITEVKSINDDASSSYIYTQGTEYVAEPQNETVKRELRKRLSPFPRGVHRIGVTALFSEYDGSVPADIQIVATRLAAGIINAGKLANVAGAGIQGESLEGHSITYNDGVTKAGKTIEGLAIDDPTIAAILATRAELYVDNDEPRRERDYDDDNGGLMI